MQDDLSPAVAELIELGCHHEQQHQELLLTDILHLFAQNPLHPAYKDPGPLAVGRTDNSPPAYRKFDGGVVEVGHDGAGFAFDCEGPRHRALIEPYDSPTGWSPMRNGWSSSPTAAIALPCSGSRPAGRRCSRKAGRAPLYWEERDGDYWSMTLRGAQPVDPAAPVTHVSYFEADAFATWAGRRLPTEFEWEHAALGEPLRGNFVEFRAPAARARRQPGKPGLRQIYGDVWEWTRSAFAPYPRFHPAEGAVGEYNGKFMCGQFVLRGGSCVTPASHMRASLSQFLSARRAMAILRTETRGRRFDMLDLVELKLSQHEAFRADVLAGLSQPQKTLPSRWLYDQRGSELFEEITRLDEYYLTRTETAILRRHAEEMAALCGEGAVLLEYGAGAAIKSEILIDALHAPRLYAPIDIAADFLAETVERFRDRFPDLPVRPIIADFTVDFDIPADIPASPARRVFPRLDARQSSAHPTPPPCFAGCARMSARAGRRLSESTCARTSTP